MSSDLRPAYAVFDVDGVLADVRHRLHHLAQRPKDWEGFFAEMSKDGLLPAGAALVTEQARLGREITYLTGRNELHRDETRHWLDRHGLPSGRLCMRRLHDRRPARLFKRDALRRLARTGEIALVVDDDPAVVSVLREDGWSVLQATWMDEREARQQVLVDAQEREGRT